ncbi:MAG: LLM class flavin-dependent oxidoreductase [Candidatus Binatia bacterium]|nr:LLM class flavin-dependent oxidoreductase [Candidatus Binatia bacterium]
MATAVQFGIGLPNGFPHGEVNPAVCLEVAERAEEYGYDSVWAGDHIIFHIPRLEIFTTLAAVAARTRRVRLGPAVLLLCLRNPVHVAQSVVTLDHLSGGRFILGVGVGGEHPKEFAASGVPVNQRGPRTDEALEVLHRLWTHPPMTFSGTYYRYDALTLLPPPVQHPYPPIWIGGRSEAALRRTVRFGQAWAPAFVTPEKLQEGKERLATLCRASGRDPQTVQTALYCFANVNNTREQAWAEAGDFLSRNYNMPAAPFTRFVICGTPAECIAHTRRYLDAGAEHLIVRFASFAPLQQLQRWTEDVLPALRAAGQSG